MGLPMGRGRPLPSSRLWPCPAHSLGLGLSGQANPRRASAETEAGRGNLSSYQPIGPCVPGHSLGTCRYYLSCCCSPGPSLHHPRFTEVWRHAADLGPSAGGLWPLLEALSLRGHQECPCWSLRFPSELVTMVPCLSVVPFQQKVPHLLGVLTMVSPGE